MKIWRWRERGNTHYNLTREKTGLRPEALTICVSVRWLVLARLVARIDTVTDSLVLVEYWNNQLSLSHKCGSRWRQVARVETEGGTWRTMKGVMVPNSFLLHLWGALSRTGNPLNHCRYVRQVWCCSAGMAMVGMAGMVWLLSRKVWYT